MEITELKNSNTELHFRVNIPAGDINAALDNELIKLGKTAKIPGFRVGKVPARILAHKYSKSLRKNIVEDNISGAIRNIVNNKKLRVSGNPEVTDIRHQEGQNLEFNLKIELIPFVPLPDFGTITIERPILHLEDNDIKEYLTELKKTAIEYKTETKNAAKEGYMVTVNAQCYLDDKLIGSEEIKEHKLIIGQERLLPGFTEQLAGSKKGDEVDIQINLPKDYYTKNIAGKTVRYKVQVLAVHKPSPPVINDEFAKKFSCENLGKLEEKIEFLIQSSYQEQINTLMKMQLFNQLETMLSFDIPASLLHKENQILKEQSQELQEIQNQEEGTDEVTTLVTKQGANIVDNYNKLAERRVRIGLMLAEYLEKKDIKVEENDIKQAILNNARKFPGHEEEIIDFYQRDKQALRGLIGPILEAKAVQSIFNNEVTLIEKTYSKAELDKLLSQKDSNIAL